MLEMGHQFVLELNFQWAGGVSSRPAVQLCEWSAAHSRHVHSKQVGGRVVVQVSALPASVSHASLSFSMKPLNYIYVFTCISSVHQGQILSAKRLMPVIKNLRDTADSQISTIKVNNSYCRKLLKGKWIVDFYWLKCFRIRSASTWPRCACSNISSRRRNLWSSSQTQQNAPSSERKWSSALFLPSKPRDCSFSCSLWRQYYNHVSYCNINYLCAKEYILYQENNIFT